MAFQCTVPFPPSCQACPPPLETVYRLPFFSRIFTALSVGRRRRGLSAIDLKLTSAVFGLLSRLLVLDVDSLGLVEIS